MLFISLLLWRPTWFSPYFMSQKNLGLTNNICLQYHPSSPLNLYQSPSQTRSWNREDKEIIFFFCCTQPWASCFSHCSNPWLKFKLSVELDSTQPHCAHQGTLLGVPSSWSPHCSSNKHGHPLCSGALSTENLCPEGPRAMGKKTHEQSTGLPAVCRCSARNKPTRFTSTAESLRLLL